ncbi:DMT family transporter [Shimia sp. MMG029]|uniref:DMT family transporter n=1 Tax=Shimia sp. MMG029 TaxID=3021978 RepID=UPI0022FED4ED|nr:DMT family transporter [Shimia sp. MMG029]MDA5557318.1 DMT family transporter [Shimia sp. MMG029]
MPLLPILAALGASFGWASGIVIAQSPAKQLGAFAFTHIQLIACGLLAAALTTALGHWHTIPWQFWPAFVFSSVFGILLGNLAMIACLRRGGPRRTELLLSLKAPIVGGIAFVWLQEIPAPTDILGAAITLIGVCIAIVFGTNTQSQSDASAAPLLHILGLGVVATALQGAGFLAMKPALEAGLTPIAATALRLLGAALLISVIACVPAKAMKPHAPLTPALLGVTVLPGVIGYIVASSLLLFAFARLDAGIAATLGALSPVLILPILWVKEKVPPHPVAILGAMIAVSGTAVIALL